MLSSLLRKKRHSSRSLITHTPSSRIRCHNQLIVSRAKNQLRQKPIPKVERDIRKLFVGGIPALTTFEEFKDYFAKYGELTDAMLPTKSKGSKLNNGFGFVTFKDPKSAAAVLAQTPNHSLRAKWVSL